MLSQAMYDHVIDERALRVEQCGILSLIHCQARSVIHGDVLYGGKRVGASKANISHVTHVENADGSAHSHVLSNDPARRRIFNRHLPAVEVHHLGTHLAVSRVKRGLAERGRGRLNSGQKEPRLAQLVRCQNAQTH